MALDQSSGGVMSEADFAIFKRRVRESFNIDLDAYKRPQMERRLRGNMEKCGATTFTEYYRMMSRNSSLAEEFLDRVTINVSELFRNPDLFETLRTRVLPEVTAKRSRVSIWSAGCSYGAEPYSVATLVDEAGLAGRCRLLATDIDDKMLENARKGVFSRQDMRNVTPARIARYFSADGLDYQAKPTLRSLIEFRKHDLLRDPFGVGNDLILCRNVVIYFTPEAKDVLYRKFFDALRPGGYLFVGGTERISDSKSIGFESACPFFYQKPEIG